MILLRKKLFDDNVHRHGWNEVLSLVDARFSTDSGLVFDDFVEATYLWNPPTVEKRPWVGIIHNPISIPEPFYPEHSMASLFRLPEFRESLKSCKCLITLCEANKRSAEYLCRGFNVPVKSLLHPTNFSDQTKFELNRFLLTRNIINLGFWLRNYETFLMLETGHTKLAITSVNVAVNAVWNWFEDRAKEISPMVKRNPSLAQRIPFLPDPEFDRHLASSICFMHLMGNGANNSILECIARNTPLLINPIESAVEYLGKDYPFYWYSIEDAERKMKDFSLIYDTHIYLQRMDKTRFTYSHFLNELEKIVE